MPDAANDLLPAIRCPDAAPCDRDLLIGLTRVTELGEYYAGALDGAAPDGCDAEAGGHGTIVARIAHRLAQKAGFAANFTEQLLFAARLHDIGKIGIPWELLMKPGPLTPAERAIVETHAPVGATILRAYRSPGCEMAQEIALHHHERWDGTGYPCRLSGQQIPVSARLVAIADVFDALLSPRCYKTAWTPTAVRDHLEEQRGQAFDPALLDLFLRDFDAMVALRGTLVAHDVTAGAESAAIALAA
jgi:putative two-component system response regulator